jgi:hypothetical protein
VKRLSKSQIPLPFEPPSACEQDGQAPHKEARPMCSPNVRADIARGTQIKKVVLILPTECVWHVLTALDSRRYGNQRVTRGLSQRR